MSPNARVAKLEKDFTRKPVIVLIDSFSSNVLRNGFLIAFNIRN
jgi:hypothetical protein